MVEYFTADDGAKLAYDDAGKGIPVLCLAGLTRNMADFDYVAPYLTGCRVIRMDYRGRGQSDYTGADTYTVPREAQDVIQLLDHLGIERTAILGTSRGGLIGLFMAATSKDRLNGLFLNDIGPQIERAGLEQIFNYLGHNPAARSHTELARKLPTNMPGFVNVPEGRWLEDAKRHYDQTPDGLRIKYDPALRDSFIAAFKGDMPDLWPLWDATSGLPTAVVRGENSILLSEEAFREMQHRRPDAICASVPDRAHIPWLDEPESLSVIREWLHALQATTT